MPYSNPFPAEDLARILPVLTLFATAIVALVLDLFLRSWNAPSAGGDAPPGKAALTAVSLAGVVLATAFAWRQIVSGETANAFGDVLRIDLFSNAVAGIILVGTLLTIGSSIGTLRRLDLEHGEFHALIHFAAGSMILLAQSAHLIVAFVSLETFSMAVYVLVAYTRDERRSVEGALKYFVLGGVASGFLLFGLALIYGATGQMALGAIALQIASGQADTPLLMAGMAMLLAGLGFKIGAFPFHSWIPDAYEGAPCLVTGFMSVTVKAAAFAVLVRFGIVLTHAEVQESTRAWLAESLWWIAAATMVFGNLVAAVQSSVKRMLAYSAISHTGYLLVGMVSALVARGDTSGAPILFYLLPYTLMTFGAFAIIAGLGRERVENETFASFRGLSTARPFLAFTMLLFMVSLAGIPPTAGFWGKFYLFREAVVAGEWQLALIGIVTSMVSAYYYLRLVVVMYMQPEDADVGRRGLFDCSWGAGLAAAVAAAGVVGLGLLPGGLLDFAARSIRSVLVAMP